MFRISTTLILNAFGRGHLASPKADLWRRRTTANLVDFYQYQPPPPTLLYIECFSANHDPGGEVVAMAEAALETERESLRARQLALEAKTSERAVLLKRKRMMAAKEAAKQKVVADFMLFIEAIEKNDMETANKFDEKAMKNTIFTMMNDAGGFGKKK
ncbi:hypothetical protein J1N35_045152 [Gossypium stocksii]|uniref:Uncharacterized protein n=1 Tax=Gossypium stocksii TaxID=47602 RepID=A0A9D3ZH45_9ROSI|nr:hypothetical protein J1N35_045152 [Gossypium stocksii]